MKNGKEIAELTISVDENNCSDFCAFYSEYENSCILFDTKLERVKSGYLNKVVRCHECKCAEYE